MRGREHCRRSSHWGSTDPNDLRPSDSEEGFPPRAWSHGVDQGHRQAGLSRDHLEVLLENSPVGDRRANGAAERAVQAIAEQLRVIRRGLEHRLELRLSGKHLVTAWLVERAAVLLSKHHVSDDGKTGYERWKGKPFHGEGSSLVKRSTTARSSRPGPSRTSWKFVGARGGAQAKLLPGPVLALYVLVPCAALELIAGGTVMVLNMSVVYLGNRIPRRATSIPT